MTLIATNTAIPAPRTDSCPVTRRPSPPHAVDPEAAQEFLTQFHAETTPAMPLARRIWQIRDEIDATGTYAHTHEELEFGARLAWRNAARCIGRLYWKSLHLRDRRNVAAPAEVAAECVEHLRDATRGGRVRSTITVFAPDRPGAPGPRIHNDQLIRYAGHRTPSGDVRGDGRYAEFTDRAVSLGWQRPDPAGRFDVLPLLVSEGDGTPEVFDLPSDAVLEVPLSHPEHDWFAELRLRWHAVPAISNMPLDIGGVTYPAAPFNGWYLGTEIGARNLADADRYDLLPGGRRAARPRHQLGAHAVARPRAGRDGPRRAALVRRRGRDDGRPPQRVAALPRPCRARGAGGPALPCRLELDRAAGVRRPHPRLPPLLRRPRPHHPPRLPPPAAAPRRLTGPAAAPQGGGRPGTWRVRPRNSATGSSPTRTVTS